LHVSAARTNPDIPDGLRDAGAERGLEGRPRRGHPRIVAAEIARQRFDSKDLGPTSALAAGAIRKGPTLVRRLQ
jgi:hypothetical protein